MTQIVAEIAKKFNISVPAAYQAVAAITLGDEIDDEVYDVMFEFYCNNGQMPYGTATAKDGDPIQWVQDAIAQEFGIA